MSLTNLNLKIFHGEEIRKVNRLPETFSELQTHLIHLFGTSNFQITYHDEQGDFITISNTEELLDSYALYSNCPSIKLYIRDFETSECRIPAQDQIESLRQSLASFRIPDISLTSKTSLKEEKQSQVEEVFNTQNPECPLIEEFSDIGQQEAEILLEEEKVCQDENAVEDFQGKGRKRMMRGGRFNMRKAQMQEKRAHILFNNPTFKELLRQEITNIMSEINGEQPNQSFPEESIEGVVHHGFTCDGCETYPIRGIRYKCFQCPNFDFCETCESSKPHPHPFIKIKTPQSIPGQFKQGRPCGPPPFVRKMMRECKNSFKKGEGLPPFMQNLIKTAKQNFPGLLNSFNKALKKQGYKVKIIENVTFKKDDFVTVDHPYNMVWKVKNTGKKTWPENATFVMKKGNIELLEEVNVPLLAPGETAEIMITFKAPSMGEAFGVWRIQSDEKPFGKFELKLQALDVSPEDVKKVKQLVGLGFTVEQALQGLWDANGSIEAAVSMIFKNIQQFRG